MSNAFIKSRLKYFAVVLIITPLGFATKLEWVTQYGWVYLYAGDILYSIFFFFLFLTIYPRFNPCKLAAVNFILDVLIELSQLYSTPLLNSIRAFFIGRTILGNGFDYLDFFYYIIGNMFAICLYKIINRKKRLH